MLDTCGKLFEKILVRRLRSYITGDAISNRQYGFQLRRSTIDAMSRVQEIFKNANDWVQAYNLYVRTQDVNS